MHQRYDVMYFSHFGSSRQSDKIGLGGKFTLHVTIFDPTKYRESTKSSNIIAYFVRSGEVVVTSSYVSQVSATLNTLLRMERQSFHHCILLCLSLC